MIECKSNQKPWIVFKGSKADLWALDAPMRNKAAQKLLVANDKIIKTGFLYNVANSAANGITQAFTSGKDVPYQALIGAFKASEAQIKLELEAEIERKQNEEQRENSHPACVFPIVITDTRLFECSLANDGQTIVNEVEYAAVGFRYPRQATRGKYFCKGAVVYIFRESAINLLIGGLAEFEEAVAEKLPILLE